VLGREVDMEEVIRVYREQFVKEFGFESDVGQGYETE
jgi:hypothetical protein